MDARQIDYAPHPSNRRRRRIVAWSIYTMVVLLLLPVGIKGGTAALHRMQLSYWQRKAMDYSLPPNAVVYDNDPHRVPGLLSRAGYVAAGSGAMSDAEPWRRFYELLSPPGRRPAPTLFLHERRNSRGEPRLVVVEESPAVFVGTENVGTALTWMVCRRHTDRSSTLSAESNFGLSIDREGPVRYFAGQPDPNDDTHFVIPFEVGPKRYRIEGWLRDDDTIDVNTHPER